MINKQGRSAQFSTAGERDTWLKAQVKDIEKTVKSKKAQAKDAKAEITDIEDKCAKEKEVIANKNKITEEHKTKKDKLNEQLNALMEKRNKLADKRKELWHKDSELDAEVAATKAGMFFVLFLCSSHSVKNLKNLNGNCIPLFQRKQPKVLSP